MCLFTPKPCLPRRDALGAQFTSGHSHTEMVQNLGTGDDVGDVTICGQTVEGVSKFQVCLPRVPAVIHGHMHRGGSQTNRHRFFGHEFDAKSLETSKALHQD